MVSDSPSTLYQFFSSVLSDDGPLRSGFLKSFPESGLLWQLFVNLRYPNFLLAIRIACIGFSLALTFANLPATLTTFRKGVAPSEPLFPLLAMVGGLSAQYLSSSCAWIYFSAYFECDIISHAYSFLQSIDNMIGLWFSMYNKEPIGLVLRSISVVLVCTYAF